jgi:hypothetical protein
MNNIGKKNPYKFIVRKPSYSIKNKKYKILRRFLYRWKNKYIHNKLKKQEQHKVIPSNTITYVPIEKKEENVFSFVQNIINEKVTLLDSFFKNIAKDSIEIINTVSTKIDIFDILKNKTKEDIVNTDENKDNSISIISKDTKELNDILKEIQSYYSDKFTYTNEMEKIYIIKILSSQNFLDNTIIYTDVFDFINKINPYINAFIIYSSLPFSNCSQPIKKILYKYQTYDIKSDYKGPYRLFKRLIHQYIKENDSISKFSDLIKNIKNKDKDKLISQSCANKKKRINKILNRKS